MGKQLDRQRYLNLPEVKSFISWLEGKLDPPGVFNHQYYLVKAGRKWACRSLYEAYENYWWPFQLKCCVNGNAISGSSFNESFVYLSFLAEEFRSAVDNGNVEKTIACAQSMLTWGGVSNYNSERIENMGYKAPNYFQQAKEQLDLNNVVLGEQPRLYMNSGFSKLYFLLVENFIMYDGRVGAALGLLGRLYAEDNKLDGIPSEIEFSYGKGKTFSKDDRLINRRNPGAGRYALPEFTGDHNRHLIDNIKASWLLKKLAEQTRSRFKELSQGPPLNERLTAIQSALFMIGYDVRGEEAGQIPSKNTGYQKISDKQVYPLRTVSKGYFFRVDYDHGRGTLCFSYPVKNNGKRRLPDYFSLQDIENICGYLTVKFAGKPFPLANNVVRLTYYTEKAGLGMAIRSMQGTDVLKAQASSYLGPYLAQVGILELVKEKPTTWRLVVKVDKVIPMIKAYHKKMS